MRMEKQPAIRVDKRIDQRLRRRAAELNLTLTE
jgi:hypothetical protein